MKTGATSGQVQAVVRRDCCLKCKHWRAPFGGRKNATCAAEEEHESPCSGKNVDGSDVTHEGCCGCLAFEKGDQP